MILILSQLIAVAIFLLVWKLRESIYDQITYMELQKEMLIITPNFRPQI